jgi:ornithine cyclodeaminase/alanine dehydrogenase-like protein (mu-crystallin family)
LLIADRDVRQLLSLEDCIDAVEQACRLYGEGNAHAPGVLGMHTKDGGFHIKAGLLDVGGYYFAAKVNGNYPDNPSRFGLPTIQGLIVLCDASNGTPLAIMDSREVTSLRTAAATAVAAKFLARRESATATICGCGVQGYAQLRAISLARKLERVFAHDQNRDQACDFARHFTKDLRIEIEVADNLAKAVRESDICVTCTSSREPLLGPDDVKPGTFLAAVGADNPHKQELHPLLMAKGKIVCDSADQCAAIGDLHHALDAKTVTRSDVYAELSEIVAGKKPGRETDNEITIFDSTGTALQDVAAAARVYEKARNNGCGTRIDLAA